MTAFLTASCATLLLLLLALSSSTVSAPVGSDHPVSCCFHYTANPLSRSNIREHYETNSKCSQPAVVFVTKKGRLICANPAEQWVQDHVNYLRGRN